jgi:Flp pilus assembly pilin Flp
MGTRNTYSAEDYRSMWLIGLYHRVLRQTIEYLVDREEGQNMVEYALVATLISIVAITIILLFGPYLDNLFGDVVNGLSSA